MAVRTRCLPGLVERHGESVGGARRHRPAGKQCDEYPFASTWQGASTGGGHFSWRMINVTQNEEGGKALGRFYLYNRVLEKDRFLVWIKP
ncbi:NucA/NucB deoxyribonuclease domain-containing protein [Streptomyces sp. NPDC003388]|uniref:NucA/NucB deoxyribonuclease domain-containing protein n=1 Tax=Streptomyces sp. ATE26 TaxID=2954237 RepID=UPI00248295C2|nr:NucA/NucB deoxyribonuclease domain-containing protein [Streptomyces sp. ATE26]MDI1455685.1 NucA/NucB deoxyribonuclease domain-containing protein [Streptomyces sp. ATE26]